MTTKWPTCACCGVFPLVLKYAPQCYCGECYEEMRQFVLKIREKKQKKDKKVKTCEKASAEEIK